MPKENKLASKRQRCEQVNQAIRIIADHSRRFFYSLAVDGYASMEVDHRGKVWLIDDYSGKRSLRTKRCGAAGDAASAMAARYAVSPASYGDLIQLQATVGHQFSPELRT